MVGANNKIKPFPGRRNLSNPHLLTYRFGEIEYHSMRWKKSCGEGKKNPCNTTNCELTGGGGGEREGPWFFSRPSSGAAAAVRLAGRLSVGRCEREREIVQKNAVRSGTRSSSSSGVGERGCEQISHLGRPAGRLASKYGRRGIIYSARETNTSAAYLRSLSLRKYARAAAEGGEGVTAKANDGIVKLQVARHVKAHLK